MEVICELCRKTEHLNNENPLAKKIRNRPIHTYLCEECHDRITEQTEKRFRHTKHRVYPHKR